jgi:hypothetical protein
MEQSLQQPINGWEKKFPACNSKPHFSINLLAKICIKKKQKLDGISESSYGLLIGHCHAEH